MRNSNKLHPLHWITFGIQETRNAQSILSNGEGIIQIVNVTCVDELVVVN
jgi:hypothetical protein